MTNSEIWLDETLSNLKGIKSDLWMLHEIMSMPNCNDCKRKDCSYKPKWGEHIRYNCPLHLAEADRKDEPTISKMEQVDKDINVRSKDEPQTENLFTDKYGDVWEWRGDAWYCISGDEPQTDTEIAKAIVHKMIDDAVIAEDAYPDLRQKMHDAVAKDEPQTERSE